MAIGGSVLAVGVPAFVRNLHASRLVEATDGLAHLAARAQAYAEGQPASTAYPDDAELTPKEVPRGEPVLDPPGTWSHATWRALEFGFSEPHWYSFEFDSNNRLGVARFTARARGDLDGDGQHSELSLSGEARDGAASVTYPLEMKREVE